MTGKTLPELLVACTARLDTNRGPRGTAFFVAPRYAITAAHVVDGIRGLPVWLHLRSQSWEAHVQDARPSLSVAAAEGGQPYPAPDVALIEIDCGPDHVCALLADQFSQDGAHVVARGHTRTLDGQTVTAETEYFQLAGELETPEPGCTLLKLGQGEAAKGMSGAPVLDRGTGEVIGMLRTSRRIGTDLGAWVVPAGLIRQLWPEEVSLGNDRFHRQHKRWRRTAAGLRERSALADATSTAGGLSIGAIHGDVGAIFSGGSSDVVNVSVERSARRRRGRDRPEAR